MNIAYRLRFEFVPSSRYNAVDFSIIFSFTMTIPAGKRYVVELEQPEGAGTVWVVHVYKKGFPFRKTISSDWFLDEEQARRFAEQVARELSNGTDTGTLKARKPGWTLTHSN